MNGVATIRSVGHDLAAKAVQVAVAKGGEAGCPLVAAVVGATGELVALLRATGAPFPSSQIAQDKAYTAASFKVPSPDVYKMVAGNPALSGGIAAKPGIAMFGGGLPIAIAGEIVGAIGVSGGTEELDTQCANAALISIGATQY
ncbi:MULTISPECIES: GlcG/HbpS family heme-binding protein [Sphingomonadales]|uniref:Uncharacterized protein n=3 Tax=Sphingomonadales TaxID=204457 RepID=A0A0G3XN52_9SPHN|nr:MULTISPECIES: heme-binding protein [Sphingomonadales]EZP70107.1 hypothetical protein BV96_03588 [Sphingomonas paucimobilis]MBF7011816.1 heme-binding protein [Novosphingobium sp. HR1a]AIT82641.1 hypothetical protein JI59_24620 [Novosphingobium pentaromativorans US6-1]AKM12059.1 hypothetical protein AB433_18140 [Croceicoccus naphthovorans]EHJ58020.1 hypothetical protein NSU_pLA1126 [Novosphingobium pentaromativorans US6-1]